MSVEYNSLKYAYSSATKTNYTKEVLFILSVATVISQKPHIKVDRWYPAYSSYGF